MIATNRNSKKSQLSNHYLKNIVTSHLLIFS